jgi:acyl-CoA dehydrogenase
MSPSATNVAARYQTRPMNCRPVATLDERINDIRMRTAEIVNDDILPNEQRLWRQFAEHDSWTARTEALELRAAIKDKVQQAGLWAPHLPVEYGGMGLDFLTHAYMNEVLAYAVGAAELFGVVAPNSGNASLLVKYGTEDQKRQWLLPLVDGTMESGFSMTEPHNAGSDPRSLDTAAVRDGDHWVINGHKWFTSNGIAADFFVVMCRVSEPGAGDPKHGPMVQIIVPATTRGVNIVRGIGVWGRDDSDHCEIVYDDVRVPIENALGSVGEGHQAAQDRLGAGRIYHCMNAVGQMWRAFDLMVQRAASRDVHGGPLQDKQFVQGFIADSYIDIQAARLMTIHAAERIDAGLQEARVDISAIKVFVPAAYTRVVDRAIQVWGAAGITNDLPLAAMYTGARTLRIADGPDEVHKILIAKAVLGRFAAGDAWDFGN